MSTKYCCDKMEASVVTAAVMDQLIHHNKDGTFCISGCEQCYVIKDAQYCPWCGASQARHAKPKQANPFPKKSLNPPAQPAPTT